MWFWLTAALALDWQPCSLDPSEEDGRAECADALLPLDHESRTGTLRVGVKRLPAPEQPARGELWFLTGGPGDSGLHDLAALDGLQERLPDLDLVSLDPRGIGGVDALECPAQQAPDSKEGTEVVKGEWQPCIAHLEQTEADRMPFLTTTQTARDLLALTHEAREDPDREVYLWGVSYGTFLAERTLVLDDSGWDGVVLDGLVPADWSFVEFDAGLDRTARAFLELCANDAECADHLGPDPVAFVEQLLADLEDGHCKRLGLDAPILRLVNGVFLMGGGELATQIPPFAHRLDRCKPRDIRAFIHLFDTVFPEEGGAGEERGGHNPVLQRQIAYADLWAEAPPIPTLEQTVEGAIATTEVTLNFARVADDWPVVAEDPLAGRTADPDLPMLLLHGSLDPTMPAERVQPWMDRLTAPHQSGWIVPYANHVTFNAGDCPIDLTVGFFTDPTAPVDPSCLDEMGPPEFGGNPGKDLEIWGTEDRWGDRSGCLSGGGAWLLLWLPLLGRRRREDGGRSAP